MSEHNNVRIQPGMETIETGVIANPRLCVLSHFSIFSHHDFHIPHVSLQYVPKSSYGFCLLLQYLFTMFQIVK